VAFKFRFLMALHCQGSCHFPRRQNAKWQESERIRQNLEE
jgi:hypothetical protein